MAEISALTLELNLETESLESGLKEIKNKFLGIIGTIDSSGNKVLSTYEGITNQLQSMGRELSNAGRGVSTLENSAGTGLASSFNQVNESLNKLQQTISILQSLNVEISIEIPITNITQAQESTNSLRDSFKGVENEVGNSGIAGVINQIGDAFKSLNENHPELLQTVAIIAGISLALINLAAVVGTVLVAFPLLGPEIIAAAIAIGAVTAGVIALIQNWDALVLAAQLNEALLNTQVDIDTVVKGERLLEFDAKGAKEIKTEEWEYRLAA